MEPVRNDSVDTLRLISAFAVILLHVTYGNLSPEIVNNIRLTGRYAVPFFFLLTGYYFYQNYCKQQETYVNKTIIRLLNIFIVASIIYLPLNYQEVSLNFNLIYTGTKYHLWFLSSMVLGTIICWYNVSYLKWNKLFTILSILTLIACLLSDSYAGLMPIRGDFSFAQYLSGVAFLFFGMLIAQKEIKLSKAVSLLLIIAGIGLQIIESRLLQQYYHYDPFKHQFLIGTIPYAFGVFFLSFDLLHSTKLATLGRKYSLSIYVYHLFINFFVFRAIKYVAKDSADTILIFSPVISFFSTLAILLFVANKLPRVFAIMNGEVKALTGVFNNKKRPSIQTH